VLHLIQTLAHRALPHVPVPALLHIADCGAGPHPFGTMKARMGATHFLTKTLPKVAAEMALSVLAYNLTRIMNIVGIKLLMAGIAA
jgi:hypothetical protein